MGKTITNLVSAATFGAVDLNKKPKVKTQAVEALEQEKIDNSKRRKALYGTSGGALGEEVSTIGNTDRGTLFGN